MGPQKQKSQKSIGMIALIYFERIIIPLTLDNIIQIFEQII